jgi:GR25 family glycosyltransferase involved in LPS biosynthesis
MTKINYIIGTYGGRYSDNENKEFVLQQQLWNLYQILRQKRQEGIQCLISQITIVCPTLRHKPYKGYYKKKLWSNVFKTEFPDIRFVYQPYFGENKDHCYDQWIQGYTENPNYDYYIFMADDYVITPSSTLFDKKLVDIYNLKFTDNIGYMASWVSENNGHPRHAAVSNGVVSRETFEKLGNVLGEYNRMKLVETYPQLKFSYMFSLNEIPIEDITDYYKILFWDSVKKTINNYSSDSVKTELIVPVQKFLSTISKDKIKKVAFYVNQFSIRGTEIAIYDYARYNELYLHNQSVILVKSNHRQHRHPISGLVYNQEIEKKFKDAFDVFEFDSLDNMNNILLTEECDVFHILKSGQNDGIISNLVTTSVQCVFKCSEKERHGDIYSCISRNLNEIDAPVIPHICPQLPLLDINLREELNIPENVTVFGRYGGIESFDIEFVKEAIHEIVDSNSNIYFLFMNTTVFYKHKQIIHVTQRTSPVEKSKFINTCNAMLHARQQGESFGISIAEFTSLKKPIISWKHLGPPHYHEHLNHIDVLGDTGIYYKDKTELLEILTNFTGKVPVDYSKLFTPEKIMDTFKKTVINYKKVHKIKVLCNWASPKEIHKKWSKMIGPFPIKFVESNPDYYVIINKPPNNEFYDRKKTIVMGMEPDTFTGDRWDWYGNKKDFLYFLDHNSMNNCEWWLDQSYHQLSTTRPKKIKGDKISTIVSSQYVYPGHILRVDFLKKVEDMLNIDIFGWDNKHCLNSYRGYLPNGKDDGLIPYKYTFAAENISRPNFFTEKICDAILSECLCFYWGCPNLSEYISPLSYISLDITKPYESLQIIKDSIKNNEWEKRINIIRKMKNRILNNFGFIPRITGLIGFEKMNKRTVNLTSRPDKWLDHLKKCEYTYISNVTRFTAIEGKNYDLNSQYIRNLFTLTNNFVGQNKNTGGIIGCALSHYTLWKEIIKTNKMMMIMEDDVTFNPRFEDRASFLVQQLQDIDFDIVFLGFHKHEDNYKHHNLKFTFLEDTFDKYSLINFNETRKFGSSRDAVGLHGGGTFGYIMSVKGAKKMNASVEKDTFFYPVDYMMLQLALQSGLNIWMCTTPMLTSPKFGFDTMDSDIQKK